MKYLIILLVSLSLLLGGFSSPGLAQKKVPPGLKKIPPGQKMKAVKSKKARKPVGSLTAAQKKRIKQRIENLPPKKRKAARQALQAKLQRMKKAIKAAKITAQRRAILNAEIQRVSLELAFLMSLQATPPPAAVPPPAMKPHMAPPMHRPVKPRPKPKMMKSRGPQFGLSAGYIAGIPGATAELRFHNPFEMIRTSIRLGAGYAQGDDTAGTTRKHALVILDGIYRLNPPQAQGVRSYIGLGFNYDAYTSGQRSGDLGYQAFYGLEAGRGSQMFFEVGYGTIRTGFSPNQNGLTAQLGYRF